MTERRQQIVAAAYHLLDSEGLEGLTIRSVLARTGLARRAFYDQFATKDDLVLAVFEYTLTSAAELFARLVTDLDDPVERLRLIVRQIVLGGAGDMDHHGRRAAALAREHFRLAEARPAQLDQAIAPLVAVIRDQLVAGMDAGLVRPGHADRLALLVYNLVSNTTQGRLIAEEQGVSDGAARTVLADDIWEFCRRAIVV